MTARLTQLIIGSLLAIGVHNPHPDWCNATRAKCTATGDYMHPWIGGPYHCKIHLAYSRRMVLKSAVIGADDCTRTTKAAMVDMTAKKGYLPASAYATDATEATER